jgi:hypothetical protein
MTALVGAGYEKATLYYRGGSAGAATPPPVLAVSLGYTATDDRAHDAAGVLQQQLGAAGILVNLVALTGQDLQNVLTTSPDLVLETVPRGASDAATGAELSGCATVISARATSTGSTTTTPAPASTATATTAATTTAGTAPGGSATMEPACSDSDADLVTSVLGGSGRLVELDKLLWSRLETLPLAEPTVTLALGQALAGVQPPSDAAGTLWGGSLRTLWQWPPPA